MNERLKSKVCIVGLGPAGIGAALTLSNSPAARQVLCIDAGPFLHERHCAMLNSQICNKEKPCQVISGFGGCSLLSGGKVSAFPAGNSLSSILGSKNLAIDALSNALELFGHYVHLEKPNFSQADIEKAKKSFNKMGFEFRYYDAYLYDHDDLCKAYEKIVSQLRSAGISLLMCSELTKVDRKKEGYELTIMQNDKKLTILTEYLVLGVGRLGRALLRELNSELNLNGEENFLDVGVRLEFPTKMFSGVGMLHNDLKLIFKDARTFCVCRDGQVVQYAIDDLIFTEGSCNSKQNTGLTNLGIMVRLKKSKRNMMLLNSIKKNTMQSTRGKIIRQNLVEFLDKNCRTKRSSVKNDTPMFSRTEGNANLCFPRSISNSIREAVGHFASQLFPKKDWHRIVVYAPEVDYGGLRFPVNSDFSIASKLYLIGDGTGRFRGILQSFCSGMVCAKNIIGDIYEKNE